MSTARPALALVVLALLAAPSAAEPPSTEQLRETVGRSLPFLEKEGLAWMRNRQCMSCHQVPAMLWGLNLAKKRDFPVDAHKLALWNEWLVDNALKKGVYYKFTDPSFASLREAGLVDTDLSKLQSLKDKSFVIAGDFHEELVKRLTAETETRYHDAIVKATSVPGQGAEGPAQDNQCSAVLLAIMPYAPPSTEAQKALVEVIVKSQRKDGSWSPGNFGQQRTVKEATDLVTIKAVLALASVDKLPEPAVQVGKRARAFLKSAQPGGTIDLVVFHTLLAHLDGDTKRSEELVQELLKHQHEDGGWGWLCDDPKSDGYATGEALHVLHTLGRPNTDPVVRKAQKFLLESQRADGTWFLSRLTASKSKDPNTKEGDAVYTYWATAWAVIGLIETLPE